MRFFLAAGTTYTASIPGISAIGTSPELVRHVPGGNAEILEYGQLLNTPIVPMDEKLGPTPGILSRVVTQRLDVDTAVLDAGMAGPTDAPTVDLGAEPGADIREPVAVPNARSVFESARAIGRALPDNEIVVGETIPGGTTTAQAVLDALGEDGRVSSSHPENPVSLKREVVDEALAASDLAFGALDGSPLDAVEAVGDPVQATVAGLAAGALDADVDVVFAGGTQMVAILSMLRHMGYDDHVSIATTGFVVDDETANIMESAAALNADLVVSRPHVEPPRHVVTEFFVTDRQKEGVGMGGALMLAERAGYSLADIESDVLAVHDRLLADHPEFSYEL